MSEKRPTFTRKSRPRLDAGERARRIAEIAGKPIASDAAPDKEPREGAELPPIPEPQTQFDTSAERDPTHRPPDDPDIPGAPDPLEESDLDAVEMVESAEEIKEDTPVTPLTETEAPAAEAEAETETEADPPLASADSHTISRDTQAPDPTDDPLDHTPPPELARPDPETPATPPIFNAPDNTAPDTDIEETWMKLGSIPVDPAHLERNLIITAGRHDPAHGAFDVLRTRLVQTLYENDWKRVAITSPTRDCGKTFTSVNLAISLSRYETNRTVLMDMDMRNPSVANVLGAANPASMGDFLQGNVEPTDFFKRLGRNALNIGSNLAVGLNDRIEPYAAELFQDPHADATLERMMKTLAPDVVLYDLPPALAFDDVIAFRKHYDGVLMVIGGGSTTADEIHESMRRIGEDVPLLGVVLNQSEGETRLGYTYNY